MFKTANFDLFVIDVAGQNSVWSPLQGKHHFRDVPYIMFVVDLSGYDQVHDNNEVLFNGFILSKYAQNAD